MLAVVDGFGPVAVDELADGARVFFATPETRNAALDALTAAHYKAVALEVEDGDWARKSQEGLRAITVGRIVVAPPWTAEARAARSAPASHDQSLVVIVQPSMGFGTGHHATTRLCLAALQSLDLSGRTVLDVGTGSGVLAIAASLLGAVDAVGIDNDEDALQSARENLLWNPGVGPIAFQMGSLGAAPLAAADVVTANLTGVLLARQARALIQAVRPSGALIISGLMRDERNAVLDAFPGASVSWEGAEDEWVGLILRLPAVK